MVAKADSFRHSVFALCMVSEQFCAMATSMVQPRYFDIPAEQHLCRFLAEHFREFKKPPNKTVLRDRAIKYFNSAKHLQGHLEEFDVLLDIVCDMEAQAAEQYDYMKASLIDYCRQQAMTAAIISSVDSIQKGKMEQIMPAIQAALMVGADSQGSGIFLLEDSDKRQTTQEVRDVVPTGYAFVDEPLKGGLAKGELMIVMAPPNTGKTSVLINLGTGIMKNRKKVAHFSLEIEQGIVRAKYDQCFLKKTDRELLLDTKGNAALAAWMKKTKKNLMGADIYIKDFPAHRLSLEMLKAHILLLKAHYGFIPDAVMVDYLDIMQHPTHIKGETHEKLDWMAVELRALAKELKVAMFTVSQSNRMAEGKETATGGEIAGSYNAKFAHPDALCSMNQTQKELENDEARVFWIKNRVGKKGRTYKLITDFDRTMIQPND